MKKFKRITNETIMEWGEYKGREIRHVPARYLLDIENRLEKDNSSAFNNGLLVFIHKNRVSLNTISQKGRGSLKPTDNESILEKALSKMPHQFTSHEFGIALKELGYKVGVSRQKEKQYFLKFRCNHIGRYRWEKRIDANECSESKCVEYLREIGYTVTNNKKS